MLRRPGPPPPFGGGSWGGGGAGPPASRDRPHIFTDANPEAAPWASREAVENEGGIVIWRIRGADAEPPPALAANLPPLVPESPLSLRWARPGNLDYVRLGWAIVPPKPDAQ